MNALALRVEGVSKMYRLGEVGTGTLSHDLNRLWARLRGTQDPFEKLGAVNDRTAEGTSDYVWALRNISFDVGRGEIVGIIGRNGAGKSTLLKLLSRVTAPTDGTIYVNGRIASLLEVGTGFHPELTGRENIFLNGAILGMTKREIRGRFEEIVEFSGCAKYIDTPVKRYSSGMHVRLAFSVAAHLETDILVVDEVLAVGDAEFQRKCLGKMHDLSTTGHRTVLFVSHNMAAVRQLCPRAILLDCGTVLSAGDTNAIIDQYLSVGSRPFADCVAFDRATSSDATLISAKVRNLSGDSKSSIETADSLAIEIDYEIVRPLRGKRLNVQMFNPLGVLILSTSDYHESVRNVHLVGTYRSSFRIPAHFLNTGQYLFSFNLDIPNERMLHSPSERLAVTVESLSFDQTGITYDASGTTTSPFGIIHPRFEWKIEGPL